IPLARMPKASGAMDCAPAYLLFLLARIGTMKRVALWSGLLGGLLALGGVGSVFAQAKNFPSDTIRVTIPFAPGGGTDFLTRTVIGKMAERTGWTMVVENKPGAAGSIAMNQVSRARPDGHELVLGQLDTVA